MRQQHIWVRVGDAGDYQSFGDDLDAVLDYLNELRAGEVTRWVLGRIGVGLETVNYWGYDFVSLFWGDANANLIRALDDQERTAVAAGLQEAYL